MRGICELGGSYGGRLEVELIEALERGRCFARLRFLGPRWDDERCEWSWRHREAIDLDRMLLCTDALVAFASALGAWARLPLDRLRVPSFTHEAELARGWPERVSIAVGPPPRYTLGDRALLKARVIAGGRQTLAAFAIDVSGAAVFAEDVDEAVGALGARGRRTR